MRKYEQKNQKDKETDETPGWLEGENQKGKLRTRSQNKSGSRELQHSRDSTGSGSRTRRIRRPKRDTGPIENRIRQGNGNGKRSEQRILDGGVEHTNGLVTTKFTFTLQEIKNSIPDVILNDLTRGVFDPRQVIQITKTNLDVSQLAEDALLGPTKITKRSGKRVSKKKSMKPSEKFIGAVSNFEKGGVPTAHTVLGYYFTIYKQLFHEEDPDFVGSSTQTAIMMVDKMVKEVADEDYKKVINFVKRIMPLWYKRLKQREQFPTNRPTVTSMFGDKRHFWANRKIYFRTWQTR